MHWYQSVALVLLTAALSVAAQPPAQPEQDSRRALDDAALTRRIEEYADTRTGQERAAEDRRARSVVERFVAAFIANDNPGLAAASSSPWLDRAELVRDDLGRERRLGEYRMPAVFAKGEQRITLLGSLEEIEQGLGKKVPEAARAIWASHLTAGSRIAVIQRGTMVLGLSLRKVKSGYSVSGLLFDYFPKADDPLLRAISKSPFEPR